MYPDKHMAEGTYESKTWFFAKLAAEALKRRLCVRANGGLATAARTQRILDDDSGCSVGKKTAYGNWLSEFVCFSELRLALPKD